MAKQKTLPTERSVTDFINSVEHETRRKDGFTILEIMNKVTGMEPAMWGPTIIGYGVYHYKYESGHEGKAPLIGFSPRKQKQVLYGLKQPESQELFEQLGKYKTGKGCLYINKLADVKIEVLEKLIEVAWKVEKNKHQ